MALWFAFVSKMEVGEFLVGTVGAAVAATGDAVIRRRRFVKFRPHPRWLLQFWREPGYVITGTALVFAVLLRRLILGKQPDSLFLPISFDAGGATARGSARRALALTLTTLGPNSIVIGIDEDKDSMLIHLIQQADVPEVTKRLGAR